MSRKSAAILVDIVIVLLVFGTVMVSGHVLEQPATAISITAALAVGLFLLGYEIYGYMVYRKRREISDIPRTLSLLGANGKTLRTWELIGRTHAIIGFSEGDIIADIDLSSSDFSEMLDPAQVSLTYSDTGWWAKALPARNGSRIVRKGQDLLLTPGVPVRLQTGDLLLLADEIQLAIH